MCRRTDDDQSVVAQVSGCRVGGCDGGVDARGPQCVGNGLREPASVSEHRLIHDQRVHDVLLRLLLQVFPGSPAVEWAKRPVGWLRVCERRLRRLRRRGHHAYGARGEPERVLGHGSQERALDGTAMVRTEHEKRRPRRPGHERRRGVVLDEDAFETQRRMGFGDTIARLIEQLSVGCPHVRRRRQQDPHPLQSGVASAMRAAG